MAILFNASPGPSVFFVSSIGSLEGKWAAVCSALGLATGSVIHALLAGIGVTAIVAANETLSILIAFFGGLYVIYLGISGFSNNDDNQYVQARGKGAIEKKSLGTCYRQGVMVEFLNPKTIIFYTSILSGLLALGQYQPAEAILISMIVPATALPIDMMFGIAGGHLSVMSSSSKSKRLVTSLSSFTLVGVGAYMLWANVLSPLTPYVGFNSPI